MAKMGKANFLLFIKTVAGNLTNYVAKRHNAQECYANTKDWYPDPKFQELHNKCQESYIANLNASIELSEYCQERLKDVKI